MKTVILHGKVCLQDKIINADVVIDDDKVSDITSLPDDFVADKKIDAKGCFVMPGGIDFHVHVDDQIGAYYIADSYKSASEIAVKNGITTFMSFITQRHDETLTSAIRRAAKKAKNSCYCDYFWHLSPVTWNWQEVYSWLEQGFKTVKLYTTYRKAGIYSSYEKIAHILNKLKSYNIRTLVHCEDDALVTKNPLRPPEAEKIAINNIVAIANKLNVAAHIVHVSTPLGLAEIHGNVSCETCPQYWTFTEKLLGAHYLCTPPLRSSLLRQELKELAQKESFDIYATDHCPFSHHDVDSAVQKPSGLPGIGALLPMVYKLHEGDMLKVVRHLAENPAKLLGLYPKKGAIIKGADADIVILNPDGPKRNLKASLADCYDPYSEFVTNLEIKYSLLRGKIATLEPKGEQLYDF